MYTQTSINSNTDTNHNTLSLYISLSTYIYIYIYKWLPMVFNKTSKLAASSRFSPAQPHRCGASARVRVGAKDYTPEITNMKSIGKRN